MTASDPTAKFLADLQKRIGKTRAQTLERAKPKGEVTHVIPTGLAVLDHYVFGYGGYPCRRMTEILGDEGSGKTSLLYTGFRKAQEAGAIAIYAECERRLNKARPAEFGVDPKKLVLLEPTHLEEMLDQVEAALISVPKKMHAILGVDTIASLPSKAEVKEGMTGKAAVAERARVLSRAIRVMADIVAKHNTALVLLNQTRTDIRVMFGNPKKSSGGDAMKYYATLRISIMGGKAIKQGVHHTGKAPILCAIKNLFVPPFRKARCFLRFDTGWHDERSTLELGKDLGIISEETSMSEAAAAEVLELLEDCAWDPENIAKVVEDRKKPKKKVAKKKAAKKKASKKAAKKKATKRK